MADPYAGVAPTWDRHAARVYGPIAADLVRAAPHPLAGRTVVDAGAGTGLVSRELTRSGARVVAVDASLDMLSWRRAERPPCAVGDLTALPLRTDAVDDVVAASTASVRRGSAVRSPTAHDGRSARRHDSMSSDASTATTRAPERVSSRLTRPVPAPASTTVRPASGCGAASDEVGGDRSVYPRGVALHVARPTPA